MTIGSALSIAAVAVIIAYLTYAILRPERF